MDVLDVMDSSKEGGETATTLVSELVNKGNTTDSGTSHWEDDGSDKTASDADTVWATEFIKVDSKVNALYSKGDWSFSPGSDKVKCFQITIVDGQSVSVGVTTQGKFGKGYATKGLLYHGNLSSGAALVESNWGPSLKPGDVVVVRLSVEGVHILLHYFLNGRALGCAFKELVSDLSGEKLYPLVCFKGKIPEKAAFANVSDADAQSKYAALEREHEIIYEPSEDDKFKGSWVSKSIKDEATDKCQLTISKDKYEGSLLLLARVGNSIRTKVSKIDGVWHGDGRVSQTLMMPPEELAETENQITEIMNCLEGMEVSSSEELTISSKNNACGKAVFVKDLHALKTKSFTTGVFK